MGKYPYEVKEKAYELFMIQHLPFATVIKKMKEEYRTFSNTTLTKWSKDEKLAWDIRYAEYCRAVAIASDKKRVKDITPIVTAIEEIREETYQRLLEILKLKPTDDEGHTVSPIDAKNLGQVLMAFTRLADLELRRGGGGEKKRTSIEQVISVIFMAIEKTPTVGKVFAAHRKEIAEAVFEEIKE